MARTAGKLLDVSFLGDPLVDYLEPIFFTGVGSRVTPRGIRRLMMRFSRLQAMSCRSGGAQGADEAFESNWDAHIYLPHMRWRGKEGLWRYSDDAIDFADNLLNRVFPFEIHSQYTRELFRRNVWQVLGVCEKATDAVRSQFVLCWTPDGALSMSDYTLGVTGGTGIAINVADLFDVPVLNLRHRSHRNAVVQWCKEHEAALGLAFNSDSGEHYSKEHGAVVSGYDLHAA